MAQHRRNFLLMQPDLLGVTAEQGLGKDQATGKQKGGGQDGRAYSAIGGRTGALGLRCAIHRSSAAAAREGRKYRFIRQNPGFRHNEGRCSLDGAPQRQAWRR